MTPVPVPQPKAGAKSTEFWLTVLAQVLGMILASGEVIEASEVHPWLKLIVQLGGVVLMVLTALGYNKGRALVKAAAETAKKAAAILLVAGLLVLQGCCVLPAPDQLVIEQALEQNRAIADDERAPQPARDVALTNYDAWCQIDRALNDTPLPPDVRKRLGLEEEE